MPDENTLNEERELCTAESLLPYCTLTSAKLIMNTMIAPTNAKIEILPHGQKGVLSNFLER
jgi:hypothetical protein